MAGEDQQTAEAKIREEILGDLSEVRDEYLVHFSKEAETFITQMAKSFLLWEQMDRTVHADERKALVSGLTFSAITLHIMSMRLFLSGYIVPAGNVQRQVLETIALALLCSSSSVNVLDRFAKDKYSSKDAVRDALRNAAKVNVEKKALEVLRSNRDFYHIYSHPSRATLASHIRFSDQGRALYVGSSFDHGKLEQYSKEVFGRLSLAAVFDNFVEGVTANVAQWKKP